MLSLKRWALVTLIVLLSVSTAAAQDFPPAAIDNDEGGAVIINGSLLYSDPLFTTGVAQPVIILEDQAGFVDRNRYFIMPVESQTLGQLTSDFYSSPVSYSLALPGVPNGSYRDVDQDENDDIGVQVFAVAYWENVFGDPYLEERDLYGGGWSGAYASTRISEDPALEWEVIGGIFVVYAPDNEQGFPSGFGEDGLLFTADDPIVRLPQGYTVVNMDTDPFTFDRSREPEIDLIEPEGAALVDYSQLSFTDGFNAMVDKMQNEYAFTEYKDIDWEALRAEFLPRFEAADRRDDALGYVLALRDFTWRIPDGHVGFGARFILDFLVQEETGGGLGIAIRELDDGRVIVNYVAEGSPAAEAGIGLRDEIVAINGTPINDAISAVVPWTSPFSADHVLRLEQLRYVLRGAVGQSITLSYISADKDEAQEASLNLIAETDSLDFAERAVRESFTGYELPLEYSVLPSGHIYVKIYSFFDNTLLSVQLWERLMQTLNSENPPGLIIDMRENLGGSGWLADQMAAYLFDEPLILGRTEAYDRVSGEFFSDDRGIERFYLPSPELRYHGPVAVLVGPNCNSACEFFAFDLTLEDRAEIVGFYPTAGLGGGIRYFIMPLGIFYQFTGGRALDPDGNIHIEGIGVQPTVRVPVTEETLFTDGDPVLDAAIDALGG